MNSINESFLDLFLKIKEGTDTVTKDNEKGYLKVNSRSISLDQLNGGFKNRLWATESLPHLELSSDKYIELHHDYYSIETVSNQVVGMLIGDYTGHHNQKTDHTDNPHIFALFVKESHRNQGIGTKLVNEFHSKTDGKIVIHIDPSKKEFYEQTEGDFIYL